MNRVQVILTLDMENLPSNFPVLLMDISLQSLPLISLDSLPAFHSKVYH
ncbi:MAG: hypothetical protein WCG74_03525 [Sediminibacterium sp.]